MATTADYARAARLFEANIRPLVRGSRPKYRWAGGGETLVYHPDGGGDRERRAIDCATGARVPLADIPPAPRQDPGALRSPDGRSEAFARDHDLWVREGEGRERRLTADGEPWFAYGKLADDSAQTLARLRAAADPLPPQGLSWSPDGRLLFGRRRDERAVAPYPYVEWNPAGGDVRPRAHAIRIPLLGDPGQPRQEPFLVDVAAGLVRKLAAPAGWSIHDAVLAWSSDGAKAYVLASADDRRAGALLELDTASGAFRTVVCERLAAAFAFNAFEYSFPNVRVLGGGAEAIWYSERDGAGGLYLYDVPTGRLTRRLTDGAWPVLDIFHVDEAARQVVFSGAPDDPAEDPYQRNLYAVGLDGGPPRRLTEPGLDHELVAPLAPAPWLPDLGARLDTGPVSPDGRWFVDVASTVDRPATVGLRAVSDGRLVALLDQADASAARAAGWRPPVRAKVKAADGITDLWATLHLPPGYDPAGRYPVVDALYAGPQLIVAPRSFNEAVLGAVVNRSSLAELGFIVVTVDARGTPGRSSAFKDVGYGNFADPQIDDHVAALRQLALDWGGMDLDRVGVYGHSFGGYVAARAMLRRPDFYKVGVSSAAVHDWEAFRGAYIQYFGLPDYGDGVAERPTADAVPLNYRDVGNSALAANLKGRLLIAYGDLDENAVPGATMRFVKALTDAGRRYDLLYLPGATHAFAWNAYFNQRLWDYFVEHLLGAAPPEFSMPPIEPPS